MSVKCQVVMDAIDKLAPRYLAEQWDNVGLLVGNPAQEVNRIAVTLDVTAQVIDQAIENGVDMIVAHHPVIFKGITQIRTDLPQGRMLAKLLKHDIAVYAAHTNLDTAFGGVNDLLATRLGLQKVEPLTTTFTERLVKLVVFVPDTHVDTVRTAISEAGAGHIGNYSHCSFQTEGMGTFLPLAGTTPFIGSQGKLEAVRELRLETILPERISRRVIKALHKAHPYEEVAYDIYSLNNQGKTYGLGRIGYLTEMVELDEFAELVKAALGIEFVTVAGNANHQVKKVALCGGSGASLIHKAVFAGANVLVTGDVKYHEAQEALVAGMAVVDGGHFATEQPVVECLVNYLRESAVREKWRVEVIQDTANRDVFRVC